MKVTYKHFFKYWYVCIAAIWVLICIHLLYLYTEFSSTKTPVKWGTFVDAVFEQVNYLPYTSFDSNDRFYQSFLFKNCLNPIITGSNIEYANDLCEVTTKNYKNFQVTVLSGNSWSDWVPVTIDDVYFTYNEIIKNNIWTLSSLEPYKNIQVYLTWNTVYVDFPSVSIDNQIFFTDAILPKHVLEGKNIQQYVDTYSANPVYSSCGSVDTKSKDPNSVVFDITKCDNNYLSYYQVKNFWSFASFSNYVLEQRQKNIVDSYIWQIPLDGYKENKVILGQFISVFFNVQSNKLNTNTRRALAHFIRENIYTGNYEKYFVQDNFLFDYYGWTWDIAKTITTLSQDLTQTKQVEVNMWDLPNPVNLNTTGSTEYYIASLDGSRALNIALDKWYDRIWIDANGSGVYFLQWYKVGTQSATYNLGTSFKNINDGKNTYTIVWYNWNEKTLEKTITIYLKTKPTQSITPSTQKLEIEIVSLENPVSAFIVSKLQNVIKQAWLEEFFIFTSYSNTSEFEGKILSKNYDIAIKWIDIGLKRDISNLFLTDDPAINPSMYVNPDLASQLKLYFTSENKTPIKKEIDRLYSSNMPFILLWKPFGNINLSSDVQYNYPIRMYDYIFRKDYLQNIVLASRFDLNSEKFFSLENVEKFLNMWLNNELF